MPTETVPTLNPAAWTWTILNRDEGVASLCCVDAELADDINTGFVNWPATAEVAAFAGVARVRFVDGGDNPDYPEGIYRIIAAEDEDRA